MPYLPDENFLTLSLLRTEPFADTRNRIFPLPCGILPPQEVGLCLDSPGPSEPVFPVPVTAWWRRAAGWLRWPCPVANREAYPALPRALIFLGPFDRPYRQLRVPGLSLTGKLEGVGKSSVSSPTGTPLGSDLSQHKTVQPGAGGTLAPQVSPIKPFDGPVSSGAESSGTSRFAGNTKREFADRRVKRHYADLDSELAIAGQGCCVHQQSGVDRL